MSGMYGADVAQLRSLAAQFDSKANELDAHRMTVGNAIRISAWIGPVAVRFRAQWDSQYSRQVQDAATRLHKAATDLRRNADEQEGASAVGGGSGGGSGGGGYSGGGSGDAPSVDRNDPWYVRLADHMLPTLESSYDLLTKTDGAMDLADHFIDWAKGTHLVEKGFKKLAILTSGYELFRDAPQTWEDIQSGNIWRFTKAIFRTGYTAAKVIPIVGLADTAASVGVDLGKGIMDTFLGPGASDRAFNDVGQQIDSVGNAINDAGAKAGKSVADGISNGIRWVKGLFS
jgi:uncharacterized protein YukE